MLDRGILVRIEHLGLPTLVLDQQLQRLAHGAKPAPVGSPARIRASDLRAPDRGFDSERRNDHLGSTIPAQNPAREIVFVSSEKANSF